MLHAWSYRFLHRWYELRFGTEEADKLISLPRHDRGLRLAFLEAYGPITADFKMAEMLSKREAAEGRAAWESLRSRWAAVIGSTMGASPAHRASDDEVRRASAEISSSFDAARQAIRGKKLPKGVLDLLDMEDALEDAVRAQATTQGQLEALRQRRARLEEQLASTDKPDPKRKEISNHLDNLDVVVGQVETLLQDLECEIKRMKRDVAEMEARLPHRERALMSKASLETLRGQ